MECGTAVENIKFAGGWSSTRSLASYLQEAEAAAVMLQLSDSASRRLEFVIDSFDFCGAPPRFPLSSLASWAQWTRAAAKRSSQQPALSRLSSMASGASSAISPLIS